MGDKILCWIGKDLTYYGITYFLNQKHDCELFSIVESSPKPRKFYEKQKLVPFKKIWFFSDYVQINNKKPDMKYLSSIEKKYGINIWLMSYSERFFAERSRFHKFTQDDILNLFEQECRFYEQVLDEIKPDFVIIRDVDMHHVSLFHEICRSRGITILSLYPLRMKSKWIVSDTDKLHYNPNTIKVEPEKQKTFDELRDYLKKYDQGSWVRKWVTSSKINFTNKKTLFSIFNEFFLTDKSSREDFMKIGRTRRKLITTNLSMMLKGRYREFFLKNNSKKEIKDEKFVFFPLHVSPERYIDISAPFFSNQLEVITNIAKALPAEYKLYVKEHFAMKPLHWRKTSFYKQILSLPNVEFIHPLVPADEIVRKSSLVIAITGTSALQAAFFEKPSIVFAHNIYKEFLSSVIRISSYEELSDGIRTALKTKVNLEELNRFVEIIEKESFDYNTHVFDNEHNPIFKTLFSDVEISESEAKTFLDHHQEVFEILSSEHLKKINNGGYNSIENLETDKKEI